MWTLTKSNRFATDSAAMSWILEQIFKDPLLLMKLRAKELSGEFARLMKDINGLEEMDDEERRSFINNDPVTQIQKKLRFHPEQFRRNELDDEEQIGIIIKETPEN